ncbi:hypothetical protein AVEN_94772-1 [Araneus ventricosus]|uniref:Uncharacterized protein n=1 Tax=Araneus ventricosus TaxID=182803 RepID=A0A4Y2CQ94_ARAVE|nr:hypothetical protein AVEN_94772-1 [Araneus ventricosus]
MGKSAQLNLKRSIGQCYALIQHIYPLEIYSNHSVFKEPVREEFNSHDVSDNENKLAPTDDVIVRKYTSSGRYVKEPNRLDLLNNVCYVFETLSEPQGGCCEVKRNVTVTRWQCCDVSLRAD